MKFSPQEQLYLAGLFGWFAAWLCFWLIPSWRARDVRRMSDAQLSGLADSVLGEMQARSYTHDERTHLGNCRMVISGVFPPAERRAHRRAP